MLVGNSYLRTAYHPISPELDPGNDLLDGGAGNDRLQGGQGGDTLTGDAGTGQYQIEPGESLAGNHDRITDFVVGADKFLLALTYYPLAEFERSYKPTDVTDQNMVADSGADVMAMAMARFSGDTGTEIAGLVQSEVAVVEVTGGALAGTDWLVIDWDDDGVGDDLEDITGYSGQITTDDFLAYAENYDSYIGDWWTQYF